MNIHKLVAADGQGFEMVESTKENAVITTEQDSEARSASSSPSSQQQLLKLARHFVIDGALLPEEKQAPLEDRAKKRERSDNLRHQQNMEAIVAKATTFCSDKQVSDRVDPDWFSCFIQFAEQVSNKTMQELWAKILAHEIAHAGSFSVKTLRIFKDLSIHDAKLLAKAVQLSIKDSHRKNLRIVSGCYQKPGLLNLFSKDQTRHLDLSALGLNYSDLLSLADNHLIFLQEAETTLHQKKQVLPVWVGGKGMQLQAQRNDVVLKFYKFTSIGVELASLMADKENEELVSALQQSLTPHFSVQ